MKTGKRRTYFPTYEYVIGGEAIRIEIDFGTAYYQYKKRDQVKIWYDSHYPSYSYLDEYKEDTFASIGCMILGSMAILCGLFVGFVVWIG